MPKHQERPATEGSYVFQAYSKLLMRIYAKIISSESANRKNDTTGCFLFQPKIIGK
jgi:hypothetical protein